MPNTGHVLMRGSLARLMANGVGMVTSFLLMPIILKGLSDRNYGIWALAGAFVGFYGIFDLGINSAVNRFTSRALGRRDPGEFNRFFATGFYMLLALGSMILAISILFPLWLHYVAHIWRALRNFGHPGPTLTCILIGGFVLFEFAIHYLPARFRIPLRIAAIISTAAFLLALFLYLKANPADRQMLSALVIILGINMAIQFPARSFTGIIESHLRYDITSLVVAVEGFARLGLVWYIFHLHFGLIALAIAAASLEIAAAFARAVLAFLLHKGLRFLPRDFSLECARSLFTYGLHTLVARVADTLRFRASPFLIGLMRGVTMVTPFAIAVRLNQVVGDVMISLMSTLAPVFSRQEGKGDEAGMRETYLLTCRIATYAAVILGGLMILLGGAFIRRWLGDGYVHVTPVMRILLIGTIFSSAQIPTIGFLYGTSRNKFYAITNSIHGILTVMLVPALIIPYGLVGVAMGITIPSIFMKFFIQPIYACRALNITPSEFYFRHAMPNFLVPLLFLAAVALVAGPFMEPLYANIFIIATISCTAFVPYVFLAGFDRSQRGILLRSIRPSWPRKDQRDQDSLQTFGNGPIPAPGEIEGRG